MKRKNTKSRLTRGDLFPDADKPYSPVTRPYADTRWLKSERKSNRRRDKQRVDRYSHTHTWDLDVWDDYSHARHPFPAYFLPSW